MSDYILDFEVSVSYPLLVHVLHTLHDIFEYLEYLLFRRLTLRLCDVLKQSPSSAQLIHYHNLCIPCLTVNNFDNVGVFPDFSPHLRLFLTQPHIPFDSLQCVQLTCIIGHVSHSEHKCIASLRYQSFFLEHK